MALTYTLISSNTLGASAASVTFSSIPQTYTDLELIVSARGDSAGVNATLGIRFNGDTATNYSRRGIFGNGGGVNNAADTSVNILGFFGYNNNGSTTNTFGSSSIYIPNYTTTANKPMNVNGVVENNSTGTNTAVGAYASLYRGTSAISSIDITPTSSVNFLAGSSFYLYGIKNS